MANTQPFNIAFGLNVANNLIVDSISFVANNFSSNSLGANTPQSVSNSVIANNIVGNTAQFLSLVANLISMNVLSGNIETLKILTSNQIFVNAISGNTGNFLKLTSNQIFVNTISGNTGTFGNLTVNNFTINNIVHVGNSTVYTNVHANAIYKSDANGSALGGPLEVVLQNGVVTTGPNFMINFSSEVTSNAYKCMKLILSNIQLASGSSDLNLRISSDGTTALSGANYNWGNFGYDSVVGAQDGDQDQGVTVAQLTQNANSGLTFGCEIIFTDTTTNSRIKSWHGHAMGVIGTDPQFRALAGFYNSSLVLKGVQILAETGNFVSCNWLLLGYRF